MTILPKSTRAPACLSDFHLDSLAAGELEADEARQAEEHLESCERCSGRAGELRLEARAFDVPLRAPPPRLADLRDDVRRDTSSRRLAPVTPLRSRRGAWVRWAGAASGVLALAAVLLLFVRTKSDPPLEDGVRVKGAGGRVGFFVEHDNHVRRGFPGEKVYPGDKLQFVVSTRESAYVAIVSIDGAQQSNVYIASQSTIGPTIAEERLPVSILLDDVLGDETLWGLVCDRPQAEAALLAALQRDGPRFSHPAGCAQTSWSITKVPRSP